MNILALLQIFRTTFPNTDIRRMRKVIQAMLSMTGRVTMLVISRWAGVGVSYHPLDVLLAKSIAALKSYVKKEFGRLDALINNAGILLDRSDHILDVSEEKLRATLDTNTYAPLALTRAFLPMMLSQNYGRIVNVSSVLGQITSFNDYTPAYRLSKLALNGITLMLADAVKGKNILINSVHSGWVKTDMGGAEAPLGLEEGARGLVWAATLPDDGPHGGFFQDGRRMDW